MKLRARSGNMSHVQATRELPHEVAAQHDLPTDMPYCMLNTCASVVCAVCRLCM